MVLTTTDIEWPGYLPAEPQVRIVTNAADRALASDLILAHLSWIAVHGLDLWHAQGSLQEELGDLGAWYRLPHGALLLASLHGRVVGVVGVHVLPGDWDVAELKRLYVQPEARGSGVGEALVRAAISAAGALGCRTIWLESKPGLMDAAIALYRRLGFRDSDRVGGLSGYGAACLERPTLMEQECGYAIDEGRYLLSL
jgi:GNAT superfamily N-acetyltransferase